MGKQWANSFWAQPRILKAHSFSLFFSCYFCVYFVTELHNAVLNDESYNTVLHLQHSPYLAFLCVLLYAQQLVEGRVCSNKPTPLVIPSVAIVLLPVE